MQDTNDDRNLHLEAVQKHDLVFGELPSWVHTEGVGRTVPAVVRGRVDHVVLRRQNGRL